MAMDAVRSAESYRYFLKAAVLVGAIAGAALGATNLTWIAVWGFTGMMPNWPWWGALVQAHGNAQLYGWCGLFIMGIAGHSLPRMLGKPAPPRWAPPVVFGLVLGGLLVCLFAQPLAAGGPGAPFFLAGTVFQWTGVTLFVAWAVWMLRLPREPYRAFVLAGTLWFWLGSSGRLLLVLRSAGAPEALAPAHLNAAYLHAMSWGFLASYVMGYSLRLLPGFTGSPAPRARAAWAALALLAGGAALEIGALVAQAPGVSAVAATATLLGVAVYVFALRVFGPGLAADPESLWLRRFARTAYVWLGVAAVILTGLRWAGAFHPLSVMDQHAFGGAARHALTVGFVSLMLVGVAWRILPIFSGAERPPAALVPTVFGLLLAGNTMRVLGQMGAGLWGGPWYGIMGASGWLETAAVGLFALDILRLLSAPARKEALTVISHVGELSLDSAVGAIVGARPWLVAVFARHGMGQVSNPMFQRTVGQRVTISMACARFQVDAAAFVRELQEADRVHRSGGKPA